MNETTPSSGPWDRATPRKAQPANPGFMEVEFVGKRGALFWLAFKTGFFTILTLGFYRFWMKTAPAALVLVRHSPRRPPDGICRRSF